MRKYSSIVLLIIVILFFAKSKALQKFLPEDSNNPAACFNRGKIGIGTQNPTSTLSVKGGFDVYGGNTNFYTNGLKGLSILYNEAYPEPATSSTISKLVVSFKNRIKSTR